MKSDNIVGARIRLNLGKKNIYINQMEEKNLSYWNADENSKKKNNNFFPFFDV